MNHQHHGQNMLLAFGAFDLASGYDIDRIDAWFHVAQAKKKGV